MKLRTMLLLTGLACPALVAAQVGTQGLIWRDGDPFVFCRYGLDQTPRSWFPMPNYTTSLPGITPTYCPIPTPYCGGQMTGWTFTEIQAYFVYLSICPQAERSGDWKGRGDGTTVPHTH